jgi:hypothetical protein
VAIQIPTLDPTQAPSLAPSPVPYRSAEAVQVQERAGQMIAQSLKSLGAGADTLAEEALRAKQESDQARLAESRAKSLAETQGDIDQFRERKGDNALPHLDAGGEDVTDPLDLVATQWQQKQQKIRDSLGNEYQKREFDKFLSMQAPAFHAEIVRHAAAEANVARMQAHVAEGELLQRQARDNILDPTKRNESLGRALAADRMQADVLGLAGPRRDEFLKESETKRFTDLLQTAAKMPGGQEVGRAILKGAAGHLSATDAAVFQSHFDAMDVDRQAESHLGGLVKKYIPPGAKPNADGLLKTIDAMPVTTEAESKVKEKVRSLAMQRVGYAEHAWEAQTSRAFNTAMTALLDPKTMLLNQVETLPATSAGAQALDWLRRRDPTKAAQLGLAAQKDLTKVPEAPEQAAAFIELHRILATDPKQIAGQSSDVLATQWLPRLHPSRRTEAMGVFAKAMESTAQPFLLTTPKSVLVDEALQSLGADAAKLGTDPGKWDPKIYSALQWSEIEMERWMTENKKTATGADIREQAKKLWAKGIARTSFLGHQAASEMPKAQAGAEGRTWVTKEQMAEVDKAAAKLPEGDPRRPHTIEDYARWWQDLLKLRAAAKPKPTAPPAFQTDLQRVPDLIPDLTLKRE